MLVLQVIAACSLVVLLTLVACRYCVVYEPKHNNEKSVLFKIDQVFGTLIKPAWYVFAVSLIAIVLMGRSK